MKKLLMMIALLGLPTAVLTGCADSKPTAVEAASESDFSMSAEQEEQYRKAMESGEGMSSSPGN